MQKITSKDNEFIKHVKKLNVKKYRDMSNEYLIEGIKLVKEAIQEKAPIKQIIICDDCENTENIPRDLTYEIAKYECIYVTKQVFNSITEVQSPQGILAVVSKESSENSIDFNRRYYSCFRRFARSGKSWNHSSYCRQYRTYTDFSF